MNGLGLQTRVVMLALLLASVRLGAGLSLPTQNANSPSTPKKRASTAKSSSVVRSTPTKRPFAGLDVTQLYAYYGELLRRTDARVAVPASRGEFEDILNVLEGFSLVSRPPSEVKARRTFGRTAPFTSSSPTTVQLGPNIRVEEVLVGLGIEGDASGGAQTEEVCAIWRKEQAKIAKETQQLACSREAGEYDDVFEGAVDH